MCWKRRLRQYIRDIGIDIIKYLQYIMECGGFMNYKFKYKNTAFELADNGIAINTLSVEEGGF